MDRRVSESCGALLVLTVIAVLAACGSSRTTQSTPSTRPPSATNTAAPRAPFEPSSSLPCHDVQSDGNPKVASIERLDHVGGDQANFVFDPPGTLQPSLSADAAL